jgi:AAA family ATP:ADP antiporter
MSGSFARLTKRVLSPIVELRDEEASGALMMFVYSFLVMAAYNIIKPSATSKFITSLGAENLPWIMLVAGVLMGGVMQGYSKLVGVVPRRWVFPGTQAVVAASLFVFWFLFQTESTPVSVAFYFWGRLLLGIFLISQFWTLANDIYDPRQAKRIFGFVGGGSLLGGLAGSAFTAGWAKSLGTNNLILVSAALLVVCSGLVILILRRSAPSERAGSLGAEEETIGGAEALRMLRQSRHLQIIAMVIGFAGLGAVVIEQQLNMAAESLVEKGDAITGFLAMVTAYVSAIGFIVQVWLTSRIHRLLGIGFALLVMPVSLGASAILILFNPALWTSGVARVLDQTLRYSLDKTTREVLFLPLPTELKLKAKPFVDVAVDRFIGKGLGSVLLLLLLKAFNFTWFQLSYFSLALCLAWIATAQLARKEYLAVFRRSLDKRELEPARVTLPAADLSTIETLVEELGSFDERRVLYAIDVLEALEKQKLINPLLLHHDSPQVRARALAVVATGRSGTAERWGVAVERLLRDEDPEVRAGAVAALASLRQEDRAVLMRPYLEDRDPRIVATAAVALAASPRAEDVHAAEAALQRMVSDTRPAMAGSRKEAAHAISQIRDPRFRHLLIPLMYDPQIEVAREAIAAARHVGDDGYFFVPTLVSLLRHRRLKPIARQVLVGYGQGVVDILGYFMSDPEEDIWVRRHIPATLALIPHQKSMNLLLSALAEEDGFLRYKAVAALEKLHRGHPELAIDPKRVEELAANECRRYFRYLGLHYNLYSADGRSLSLPRNSLLDRALEEKKRRVFDRMFRLLGLLYPWKDVEAARRTLAGGDARLRASAAEYLDNVIKGPLRRLVMPILEDMPLAERVAKGNVLIKTRKREVSETLARLMYDEDPVVAATAIDSIREHQVWGLADDLEQVLAFRDARDWYVFEAASWALAAHRLPEEMRRVV